MGQESRYPSGRLVMLVLFLNELSSAEGNLNHVEARDIALDLIRLLRNIRKERKQIALNSAEPIKYSRIDSSLTFQELLGGDEYRDEWRFLRGFLNRSPIDIEIQAITLDSQHEKEYLWKGVPAIALGWADSLDTAIISFTSSDYWKQPTIPVCLNEIDNLAEIIESENLVRNFALTDNVTHHIEWLKDQDSDIYPSADEFWAKREEYFPNLRLLDRTREDILRLYSSRTAYHQMYIKLKKLDDDTMSWKLNEDAEHIQYSGKTTPEAETRKRLCNLTDVDGNLYCFHIHQRFTGNIAGRIHFRVSYEEKKVVVAYIGEKLTIPIMQ